MTSEVMDSVFPLLNTAREGMTAFVGKGARHEEEHFHAVVCSVVAGLRLFVVGRL
jgi:hypothetical protein